MYMHLHELQAISKAARSDIRTVKAAYDGKPVRTFARTRIDAAAEQLGYTKPPEPGGEIARKRAANAIKKLERQSRQPAAGDGSDLRYFKHFSVPSATGNLKPSLKAYLELPITVRSNFDAYPLVNDALERLAEGGQFLDAAVLCDAMRTDDRIIGCLSTRVNAVFGLPMEFKWQGQDVEQASAKPGTAPGLPSGSSGENDNASTVNAGDSEDSPEVVELKKRVCELVEDNWERMLPSATMKEIAAWGALLNLGLGELVWDWDEIFVPNPADPQRSEISKPVVFPTIKSWHPQFIYWRWDTRSFWLIHQDGQTEIAPGDGRWVQFSPSGHNHGWLYGLVRALAMLWIDRKFLWRDWARASEKFGIGVVKAYEPQDADVTSKAAFDAGLQNMASESTIRLPTRPDGSKAYDVEMLRTSDTSVNTDAFFETRVKRIDTCIAVCVLGQNLSTEISGSSGSRAAAQVHENVRADFLKADIDVLKQMVTTQILSPFVRYNFESEAEALGVDWRELVPEVTWKVDPPEDKDKTAGAVQKIAAAIKDLAGTEADIHALLDKYDVPVLDEKRSPDVPPPAPGQTPERPRPPGGTIGVAPPGLGDVPEPSGSADQPLEGEERDTKQFFKRLAAQNGVPLETAMELVKAGLAFKRDTFGNRSTQELKPGARKGQVYVDDLADAARAEGGKAMDDRVVSLLEIVRTSADYDEMRERVKKLYRDLEPSKLRRVVERTLLLAELVGRLSAKADHRAG